MMKKFFSGSSEIKMPLLLSIMLHGVLITVLLGGLHFSEPAPTMLQASVVEPLSNEDETTPQEQVEVVQAVTVDQAKVDAQIRAIQQAEQQRQDAEERRIAELERRAAEAKRQREAEQRKQRDLAAQQQAERQKLEREKAAAAKEKEQIERERKAAEAAAKAAEEKRKREELAAQEAAAERERIEQERLAREKAAQEKAERERQLQERLAQEAQARRSARSQQIETELQRYTILIRQTIQRNFNRDDSMRGKQCELTISLSPSGFVKSVTTGNGDAVVCQAAQNAVLKAGTLPVSQDPEVYQEMTSVRLVFVPEF